MNSQSSVKHIAEIDALRGIAVILVVLYHAYPTLLPGGFIGVDVFFVISGFVISRTYLWPLINMEVSLGDFYLARLRRLTPAIFVICFVSMVVTYFFALPDRVIAFAWSLLAQLVYAQNFVFWIEGDYFSGALAKPLLHTWSLAIEEQFYIFWAVLILFFRKIPRAVAPVVILLAVCSLMAGFALEGRSPKTVFFLLPFRIWEFAVGILIFHFIRGRVQAPISSMASSMLVLSGLISILAVSVFFNKESSFPGVQALIACGATALIILVYCTQVVSGGPLSLYLIQYCGKISYSLYLWHWPPLVFYYLQTGTAPGPIHATILVAFSIVGAIASYYFIENPIRRKSALVSSASFFCVLGISVAFLLVVGTGMIASQGLLYRYSSELQPLFSATQERGGFRCGRIYVLKNPSSEFCELTNTMGVVDRSVLILGDSHADVLKELLADVGNSQQVPIFLAVRNCDLGRYGTLSFCSNSVFDSIISQAKQKGVTDVVAISYWEGDKFDVESLSTDLHKLINNGMRVHILAPVPSDESYDPRERAKKALDGSGLDFSGISIEKHKSNAIHIFEKLQSGVSHAGPHVRLIDPSPYFCASGQCVWHKNGVPLYLDSNHLTFTGAEVIRPMFTRILNEIVERK